MFFYIENLIELKYTSLGETPKKFQQLANGHILKSEQI